MRSFTTKPFARWAAKEGVPEDDLRQAVKEIEQGLIDARLGGWLIKKRIGVEGRGKRGGVRTIIAFRAEDRLIFLEGFAKNDKANITTKELEALRLLGDTLMGLDADAIAKLAADGNLRELKTDVEDP
jgi:hypothetical protein